MTDHESTTTDAQPTPNADTTSPAVTTSSDGDELTRVRELVLKAHPDVVPDLIRGESFDDLMASIEPARTAYQRIADHVRAGTPSTTPPAGSTATPRPPHVPAGGATTILDPSTLTPTTKIARALAERREAGGGRREG